jgi:hypothetical protein
VQVRAAVAPAGDVRAGDVRQRLNRAHDPDGEQAQLRGPVSGSRPSSSAAATARA